VGAFGDRLKKEREQRKLTLEDISQATKINLRSLRALEQEDFAHLPGGVFNRGFIRAYARHLGADEESLIAAYLEASGEGLPQPPSQEPEPPKVEQPAAGDGWPRGVTLSLVRLSIGVALVALTLLAFFWLKRHQSRAAEPVTPAATHAQPIASPSPANPPSSTNSSPAPKPGTPPSPAPQPVQPTAEWSNVIPQSAAQSQPIPPANAGIELTLHALDEVWLSASIDGQPVREDTLFYGNRRTLLAKEKIILKVGNAGSLEVSFNGKRLPSLGNDGQVKTLVFLPSGLEPPPPPTPRTRKSRGPVRAIRRSSLQQTNRASRYVSASSRECPVSRAFREAGPSPFPAKPAYL
jgi:cytoskeletal protein RodZ